MLDMCLEIKKILKLQYLFALGLSLFYDFGIFLVNSGQSLFSWDGNPIGSGCIRHP